MRSFFLTFVQHHFPHAEQTQEPVKVEGGNNGLLDLTTVIMFFFQLRKLLKADSVELAI